MPVRVRVDPELCVGSSECVRLLPDAFRIDRSRGVSVPTDAAAASDAVLLAEAVRACPMQAITVEGTEA